MEEAILYVYVKISNISIDVANLVSLLNVGKKDCVAIKNRHGSWKIEEKIDE